MFNLPLYVVLMFVVIVVLQIVDGYTTWRVLSSGSGTEANKILKALMDGIGVVPTLILTKTALMGFLVCALAFFPSIYLFAVMGLVVVFYGWVCFNNAKIMN